MKIVVDTNILVSSSFWNGASDKVIKIVENSGATLFLSEEIINEFSEVLEYEEIKDKIKNKNLEMKRTIEKIISLSSIITPLTKLNICQDPEDNIILECAKEANADYIITQDNHLLKLSSFEGIKIITPEEFLKITQ